MDTYEMPQEPIQAEAVDYIPILSPELINQKHAKNIIYHIDTRMRRFEGVTDMYNRNHQSIINSLVEIMHEQTANKRRVVIVMFLIIILWVPVIIKIYRY